MWRLHRVRFRSTSSRFRTDRQSSPLRRVRRSGAPSQWMIDSRSGFATRRISAFDFSGFAKLGKHFRKIPGFIQRNTSDLEICLRWLFTLKFERLTGSLYRKLFLSQVGPPSGTVHSHWIVLRCCTSYEDAKKQNAEHWAQLVQRRHSHTRILRRQPEVST